MSRKHDFEHQVTPGNIRMGRRNRKAEKGEGDMEKREWGMGKGEDYFFKCTHAGNLNSSFREGSRGWLGAGRERVGHTVRGRTNASTRKTPTTIDVAVTV